MSILNQSALQLVPGAAAGSAVITYFNENNKPKDKTRENFVIGSSAVSFIGLFIALLCIYLSWSRNTRLHPNMNIIVKILYAFIASIFGIFYLIFWGLTGGSGK